MTNVFSGVNAAASASEMAKNPNLGKSVNGEDNKIAISEIAGIVGGIAGGLAMYGETKNLAAGIGGALVGSVCGYGMGNMLSSISKLPEIGVGTQIVVSTVCASFGISTACMGGSIIAALTGSSE